MGDLQFWPTGTTVGLQTFGGGRLRFLPAETTPSSSRGAHVEFEFARTAHDVAIHQILPPVQFYGAPSRPTVALVTELKLYQIVQANNRYLRTQHPVVDLPKALLLEYILEDQELPEKNEPLLASMLAGLSIDDQHDLIVSVGGTLGNELNCMFIENAQSDVPKLSTTSKPAAILRTPVQQLASGPSLNHDGKAVFLARTHDATSFFTYSRSSRQDRRRDFEFSMCSQLRTTDTGHQIHVDCCVGHTINDTLHQFIVLNSKAQLWKVSGIGGSSCSAKPVGHIKRPNSRNISWARCGIYPTNDCLVVGLRNSVGMVDPRLYGECSNLYTVSDGHRVTDIQRYINNRSPHLRLINTTSSIVCIDDRKPNVPMLTERHFRSQDLTLSMSFSAEPEWSPHASYSVSTAAERFDNVLLWSRANDVASLHQFKAHPGVPPAVLGYPSAVPVTSCSSANPRAGLLFFRRPAIHTHPEKLCVVEIKRDGSLWHQQLALCHPSHDPPQVDPSRRGSFHSGAPQISLQKLDSEDDDDGNLQIPKLTFKLKFETTCPHFTKACLTEPSLDPLLISALPCVDFMDPLNFCMLPKSSWIVAEGETAMVDVTAALRSFLSDPKSLCAEDETMMEEEESGTEADDKRRRQQVAEILATTIKLSSKIPMPLRASGEEEEEEEESRSACGSSGMDEAKSALAADRVMEEWKLGEPTLDYEWKDICAAPGKTSGCDTGFQSGGDESDYAGSCHSTTRSRSRSQLLRRDSTTEPHHHPPLAAQQGRREDTVDSVIQVVSRTVVDQTPSAMSVSTIPRSQTRKSSLPNHPHPQRYHNQSTPSLPAAANFVLGSNSQPVPLISIPSSPTTPSLLTQPYSQLVPGTHATRSSSTITTHARKKKRLGGF
ncbi:hypothetical protein PCANC_22524 [Puccinia coronata f. sp. avenae]|uniref:RRN6 K-rich C-terminal domain-containing protein n=1 Tax=Puccinia coronata f. sp. avenae TaxID=200324 RepID=A0A2N5S650_9BASI|nr:hypothetical protein PCANC_22524 [Puccinia coronata f. sp. avenae]